MSSWKLNAGFNKGGIEKDKTLSKIKTESQGTLKENRCKWKLEKEQWEKTKRK